MNKVRLAITAIVVGALTACAGMSTSSGKRELMIVGNDEKVIWDESGKIVFREPGKDTVSIVDIGTDPLAPKIIANLPLKNSIFGPPTCRSIARAISR